MDAPAETTPTTRPPTTRRSRRRSWTVASVLLLGAAAATAWSTYLSWLPCRGSALRSLIFVPDGRLSFSDACLQQMDAGTYVSDTADGLRAVAMALAGLAWLALLLGMRWPRRTTAVAVLPALLSVGLACSSAIALTDGHAGAYPSPPWWLLLDASALAVMIAVGIWHPQLSGLRFIRLMVILWGATGFGFVHQGFDYAVMTLVSVANWDTPPGTGYPTAVALAVAAGLCVSAARHAERLLPPATAVRDVRVGVPVTHSA